MHPLFVLPLFFVGFRMSEELEYEEKGGNAVKQWTKEKSEKLTNIVMRLLSI